MSDINTTSDADETKGAQRGAVGVLLRDTRIAQGLEIADVARALRIAQRYLEALENDRDQDLPGPTYAIGFVRSYCEHLSLDSEEIVRRYKNGTDAREAQTDLVFPKPISDGGVPGAVVLGVGLLIAAVAYGVWYWRSSADTLRVAQVDPVPTYLSTSSQSSPRTLAAKSGGLGIETRSDGVPATAPAREQVAKEQITTEPTLKPSSAGSVVKRVSAPQGRIKTSDTLDTVPQEKTPEKNTLGKNALASSAAPPANDVGTVSQDVAKTDANQPSAAEIALVNETPPPLADAKASPLKGTPAKATAVVPRPSSDLASSGVSVDVRPSRITVQAKSNSWIQIRDETANRLLFTRLLRRGDSYKVPDRAGLRLMTGNAGALEIFVDGKIVPALGAAGEVRRDVELDPDKLKSGTSVAN